MGAFKNWALSGLGGAVAAILLAGCTPPPEEKAKELEASPKATQVDATLNVPTSPLAGYLAGRMAQFNDDAKAAAHYFTHALKYDPEQVHLLGLAFGYNVTQGNLTEAAKLAPIVAQHGGNKLVSQLVLGVEAAHKADFTAAEQAFSEMPATDFLKMLRPVLIAFSQAGQGRIDDAVASLDLAPAETGQLSLTPYFQAVIYDLGDRLPEARSKYMAYLDNHPHPFSEAVKYAGLLLQRQGDQDAAAKLYERFESVIRPHADKNALLALGKDAPRGLASAQHGIAEILFAAAMVLQGTQAGDLSQSMLRQALYLNPDYSQARLMLGEHLARANHYKESNEHFLMIKSEKEVVYSLKRAALNAQAMEDVDQALSLLDEALKHGADKAEIAALRGEILQREKRYEEANKAFSEAIAALNEVQPNDWLLFFSRGVSFERTKQWPQAEADFKRALELKSDQPDVLNYLGYSWVDKGMNLTEARQLIEKAVALRPEDGAIVDSLGWALYRLGEFEQSVVELERAAELVPHDPTVNDHLGDAYYRVGRVVEAIFQWKRALSLDPEADAKAVIETKIETGTLPN